MRRSLKILVVTAVIAVATVGLAGVAAAGETTGDSTHMIADGAYTLTLPGIGALSLDVTGGEVTVSAPGTAFDGQTTAADHKIVLTSEDLTIKVRADDGTLVGGYKVDLGESTAGAHQVTVGNLTFTVTVADDGSLSASGPPDGYTMEARGRGVKLTSDSGTILIISKDGTLFAWVSSPRPETSDSEKVCDRDPGKVADWSFSRDGRDWRGHHSRRGSYERKDGR